MSTPITTLKTNAELIKELTEFKIQKTSTASPQKSQLDSQPVSRPVSPPLTPVSPQPQPIAQTTNTQFEILNKKPHNTSLNLLTGGHNTLNIDDEEKNNKTVELLLQDNNNKTTEAQEAQEIQEIQEKQDTHETVIKDMNTDLTTGGAQILYNLDSLDYLLSGDKDLINLNNVHNTVDKYINNYYSDTIKTYKQSFKKLYQKYSNKHFIINNIGTVITVITNTIEKDHYKDKDHHKDKDDKYKKNIKHIKKSNKITTPKQVKPNIIYQLNKPIYLFYNDNNNLQLLKRQISNNRVDLQLLYQKLINKLNVEIEEKKHFEKQRAQFIELLEEYYTYTLYHKKINKISLLHKTNIILQSHHDLYTEYKLLESGLYYIDKSNIELINNFNTNKLNEYNKLITSMHDIKDFKDYKDIKTNKTHINTIKTYINNSELDKIYESINEQKTQQKEYINYIITKLP